MPLQNRVLPTGAIVADPARGTLTGNRGILHGADRRLGRRRWTHPHWISCTLDWGGVRRVPMTPGTWTELFFLDEAVALAAGHRPCALCRRPAFRAFQAAWAAGTGLPAQAPAIDRALHAARLPQGRTDTVAAASLPDGAMLVIAGQPHLLWAAAVLPFAPAGYGPPRPRPTGPVAVLTPEPLLATLAAGYVPQLHPSAQRPGARAD